ncbi:helix-turn-helix domain-containing protein [Streptomyces griseoluteus]|uniref:helix-turn-helix domain-containing protein n=1 Tax=Streptomyces griseoluteus TaxID=29306 RepID=UPI003669CB97
MATKWTRLGEKLRAARVALEIEQQEVAARSGVSRGAIRNIERGDISRVSPTVRQYAAIVGWTEDSLDLVLAGGEPKLAGPADTAVPVDLAVDVQDSLRRGPLLRSQVVEVETPAGKVRATIVLRGEEGASAEALLASLRAVKVDVSSEPDHPEE